MIITVTGYPRSGSNYLSWLIAEAIDASADTRIGKRIGTNHCVVQRHFPPFSVGGKAVHIIRDPRDIAVSAFHFFHHDYITSMSYIIRAMTIPSKPFLRTWRDEVIAWLQSDHPVIRYEYLYEDTAFWLDYVLTKLGIEHNHKSVLRAVRECKFDKMSEKFRGHPKHFYKGGSNWMEELTNEEKVLALELLGDAIIEVDSLTL